MHLDLDRLAQLRSTQARLPEGDRRPRMVPPRGIDVRAKGNVQGEADPVVVVEPAVGFRKRAPAMSQRRRRSQAQIPLARVLRQRKSRLRLLDVEQGAEIVGTVRKRAFDASVAVDFHGLDAKGFRRHDPCPAVYVENVDQGEPGVVERALGLGQAQLPLRDARLGLDDIQTRHPSRLDQNPVYCQLLPGPFQGTFRDLHRAHCPDQAPVGPDGLGDEVGGYRLEGENVGLFRAPRHHDPGGADRHPSAPEQGLPEREFQRLIDGVPVRRSAPRAQRDAASGGNLHAHRGRKPERRGVCEPRRRCRRVTRHGQAQFRPGAECVLRVLEGELLGEPAETAPGKVPVVPHCKLDGFGQRQFPFERVARSGFGCCKKAGQHRRRDREETGPPRAGGTTFRPVPAMIL